jgi:hypothetical protein
MARARCQGLQDVSAQLVGPVSPGVSYPIHGLGQPLLPAFSLSPLLVPLQEVDYPFPIG